MLATTSDAKRKPIWIFGASAFGRPSLRRNSAMASMSAGIASRTGRMPLKSSRVTSRTSPSSSLRGGLLLGIEALLAPVGFTKTDDPKRIAANAEADDVKPPLHRRICQVSRLAVGLALILDRVRRIPIQIDREFEGKPALFGVPRALRRVKLDLHALL